MTKKTVFLTGGTGNMGWAGFQELYRRNDRFDIRLLARDSRKNRKMLDKYASDPSVSVVCGVNFLIPEHAQFGTVIGAALHDSHKCI